MDFKIFLVFTITFFVQVFCEVPVIPAKTPELIEAYKQIGDFGSSVTFSVMGNYLKDDNSDVPKCYEKVKQRYEDFTKNLADEFNKAVTEVGKPLKPNHQQARQKTQAALRRMVKILKEYPTEIGKELSQNDKEKAAEKVKYFRIRFEYNFVLYTAEINKLKQAGKTEVAKKADSKVQEIRHKADKNSNEIIANFNKCMGVNPPKNNFYDSRYFWTSYLG